MRNYLYRCARARPAAAATVYDGEWSHFCTRGGDDRGHTCGLLYRQTLRRSLQRVMSLQLQQKQSITLRVHHMNLETQYISTPTLQ